MADLTKPTLERRAQMIVDARSMGTREECDARQRAFALQQLREVAGEGFYPASMAPEETSE